MVEKRKGGKRNNHISEGITYCFLNTMDYITISGFKMLDLISLWGKTTPPLL